MERNVALLNKVMDFIEDHPRQHRQDYLWEAGGPLARLLRPECGSTGCFAGWAAHFADAESVDQRMSVLTIARVQLGLTWDEATWFFSPIRTRPELRKAVDALTAEQARRDARRAHREAQRESDAHAVSDARKRVGVEVEAPQHAHV